MGLLRAIEWLQRRKLAALALGPLAMSLIGTDDSLRGIRGIGGRDEDEAKILSSISDETDRLLRSPLFDAPR
jgi:hypothetical protein